MLVLVRFCRGSLTGFRKVQLDPVLAPLVPGYEDISLGTDDITVDVNPAPFDTRLLQRDER